MATRAGTPFRSVREILQNMVTTEEVQALIEEAKTQLLDDLAADNRLLPPGGLPPSTSPPKQYVTDPYESNFNPGDKLGADLYKTATEPLKPSERFNLTQEKAAELLRLLKEKSQAFYWGSCVNLIPQSYPATMDNSKSLLLQPNCVSLLSVQREAAWCWGV